MNSRDAITAFLFVRDEPAPVDLAIVLGAPTPSAIGPAIDLFRHGLAPRILITGQGPESAPEPEWSMLKRHALKAGVPESALLIEPDARNTRENLLFAEALVEREIGWPALRTVAISCKPFHARRALMTARRLLPPHLRILMIPPVDPRDLQPDTWWRTPAGRQRIFGEIRRIGEYALLDHLSDA